MSYTVQQAISSIKHLQENTNVPLIDLLRPWMVITGLDFKDAIHLTHMQLTNGLCRIYNRLGDSLDIFDGDQLQEAACRCLQTVTVYGEPLQEEDTAVAVGQTIQWDGSRWIFISDPKMRLRESAPSYKEALEQVKKQIEG